VEHPLRDFRLKLNRANTHLETLKGQIDAWFDQHPYGVTGHYNPGPPEEYILYLRFFEPPPREWGILIGEFAHNARSALDYLAWQLVKANHRSPNRLTQFPMVFSPWDWPGKNGVGRLRGAAARHVAMVERLQPYNRTDTDDWSYARRTFGHPLAVLNFLSNEDKHRVLIIGAAALASIGWDITATHDVRVKDWGEAYMGPLVDQAPLITIPVEATGPNPEVEVEFTERARVTVNQRIELPDKTWWQTRVDLLESLEAITVELRRIFQVFVREFV
jgi:hypothetical protein